MATRRAKKAREVRIALAADLRIGSARAAFAALQVPEPGVTVVIDAAPVSKVDAAGLQAIVAGLARWRSAGTRWRWENPAPALVASARLAGLAATLGLP